MTVACACAMAMNGFSGGVALRSVEIADAPFAMPPISECVFPTREFSIVDYGASTNGCVCTEAFRRAMAACHAAGGGRVVVPEGRWLTGAIRFKSDCELHLSDGAVLEFTDDPDDYPPVPTTWEGVECTAHSPLVFGLCVTNVALTGKGTIRPRMKCWRDWFERPPEHMRLTEQLYHWGATNAPFAARNVLAFKGANVRPHLIQFNCAKNVRLDGFKIVESPFWTIHLYRSEDCIVRDVDISAHGHNNDGIDVDMTRNVLIEGCTLDQGDDGICLKSGRNQDAWRINRPTENVVVRRCHVKSALTLLGIGSELSGGIRNVWVTDCDADAVVTVLRVKTNRRRGGFVRGIWMDHCRIGETERLMMLETDVLYQWARFPDYEIRRTQIEDITMSDVDCACAVRTLVLKGDPACPSRRLHVRDVRVGSVVEEKPEIFACEDLEIKNVRCKRRCPVASRAHVALLPVGDEIGILSPAHAKAAEFLSRPDLRRLPDGHYDIADDTWAEIGNFELRPCAEATFARDERHDTIILLAEGEIGEFTTKAASCERLWVGGCRRQLALYAIQYAFVPAGESYADRLVYGNAQPARRIVVKIPARRKVLLPDREVAVRAPNYDESRVGPYTLEDPLTFVDGHKVGKSDWPARRREILDVFAKEMFGAEPPPPEAMTVEQVDEKVTVAGFAIRRMFKMWFKPDRTGPCVNWIVWTPRQEKAPAPVILFLNYRGNHELVPDEDIPIQEGWVRNNAAYDIANHRSSPKTRGLLQDPNGSSVFPLGMILARGYAVASACYCEVSPDPTAGETSLFPGFICLYGCFRIVGDA